MQFSAAPDPHAATARGAFGLAAAAALIACFALAASIITALTPADPLPKLGVCVQTQAGIETETGSAVVGVYEPSSADGVVSCAVGEWRSVVPQEYRGA